jgi:hypothetical protein
MSPMPKDVDINVMPSDQCSMDESEQCGVNHSYDGQLSLSLQPLRHTKGVIVSSSSTIFPDVHRDWALHSLPRMGSRPMPAVRYRDRADHK